MWNRHRWKYWCSMWDMQLSKYWCIWKGNCKSTVCGTSRTHERKSQMLIQMMNNSIGLLGGTWRPSPVLVVYKSETRAAQQMPTTNFWLGWEKYSNLFEQKKKVSGYAETNGESFRGTMPITEHVVAADQAPRAVDAGSGTAIDARDW